MAEGEVVDGAGEAAEAALTMIAVGAPETVAGVVGAGAHDQRHDQCPGHPVGVVPLLANPRSVRGVLGLVLSVLPEGITHRDGTRGRTRDPALPRLVDGSAPSPLRRPANASLVLVVRDVIAVVRLPAEGGTPLPIDLGHAVEAPLVGRIGVVGVPLLHDAEEGVSPGPLPQRLGDAEGALVAVAAEVVASPPMTGAAWVSIKVA